MSTLKIYIAALILLSVPLVIQGQASQKKIKNLTIIEESFPDPNPIITYKLTNRKLVIYSTDAMYRKLSEKSIIFVERLNSNQLDSLNLIINNIDFPKTESSYSGVYLDGTVWTFKFESKEINRVITFDNCQLPEFCLIIDFLNRQIPSRKRYITFDNFGRRVICNEKN